MEHLQNKICGKKEGFKKSLFKQRVPIKYFDQLG